MNSKFKVDDVAYFFDFGNKEIIGGLVKEIEYNGTDDYLYTCIIYDNSLRYIWETDLDFLPIRVEELLLI